MRVHLAATSAAASGAKIFLYPEQVLMAALAEKLGRPVKWIETPTRELHCHHPRPRPHHARSRSAAQRDGTITALRVKTYANLGA